MNWYKTAKKFTDEQQWVLHGVDPQACRDEFKEVKFKQKEIQKMAHKKAKGLGHQLFRNWTAMNSNRCRKCGMSCFLPNIVGQTDSPDMIGAAVNYPCNVHLDNVPKDHFNLSDDILDRGNPLNKHKTTTIL